MCAHPLILPVHLSISLLFLLSVNRHLVNCRVGKMTSESVDKRPKEYCIAQKRRRRRRENQIKFVVPWKKTKGKRRGRVSLFLPLAGWLYWAGVCQSPAPLKSSSNLAIEYVGEENLLITIDFPLATIIFDTNFKKQFHLPRNEKTWPLRRRLDFYRLSTVITVSLPPSLSLSCSGQPSDPWVEGTQYTHTCTHCTPSLEAGDFDRIALPAGLPTINNNNSNNNNSTHKKKMSSLIHDSPEFRRAT